VVFHHPIVEVALAEVSQDLDDIRLGILHRLDDLIEGREQLGVVLLELWA